MSVPKPDTAVEPSAANRVWILDQFLLRRARMRTAAAVAIAHCRAASDAAVADRFHDQACFWARQLRGEG